MAEAITFVEAPAFPTPLTFGSRGGPRFSTDVLSTFDGTERRNQNWANALCVWDVGSVNRTHAEILLLLEFFYAVARGQLYGFRFRDFTDYQFANGIGTGDGTTQTFALVKTYSHGLYTHTRRLYKPRAGTLHFTVNGLLREDYDIDFATGEVTFWTAPPAGAVVAAHGEFDVPVRFAQDHLPVRRIDPHIWSCEQIELVEVRP